MATPLLPIIWTVAGLNFLIMMSRLLLRGYNGHKLEVGDVMAIALIGLNWAHAATIHVVIAGGKDSMTDQHREGHQILMQEFRCGEVASTLSLLAWTENAT